MSKISTRDISVNYGHLSVLKNIKVEAGDKEFVAIVGPSGCGKTTLLKCIAGLLTPDKGEIWLDGENVTGQVGKAGYVFQNCVVFPWLTVLENVAFGVRRQHKEEWEVEAIVRRYLRDVGLRGKERAFVSELSGGMRQRLAIAMVLATSPEVLLMDEPFSSLDTQTKGLMQELLSSIWESDKKTVIFVTHDIEEAIFLADRVYVMGARPGTIEYCIPVPLPRPRTSDVKLSSEFFTLKKHLSYLVRGEAIKSANVQLTELRPNALKIGVHAWPGNSPFYLAREWGWFAEKGLEVELVDLEKQDDRFVALTKNEVDVFVTTLDGAVRLEKTMSDLRTLAVLNQSKGGDGILVRNGIASFNDLKGKLIATEKNWVSQYFLLYMLRKNGLSLADVKTIDFKGSDIGAALISGHVDAAVTFEPWLTQAKQLSGAVLLASTLDYPVIYDVLVARDSVVSARQEEIDVCMDIWYRAVEALKKNTEDSLQAASLALMVSKAEVKQQLDKVQLMNREESRYLLEESKEFTKLRREIRDVL